MTLDDATQIGALLRYEDEDGYHEGIVSRRITDDDGEWLVLTKPDGSHMRLEIETLVLVEPTIH